MNKPWVCKAWTRTILNLHFWKQKLKKDGIVIEPAVWSELQECDDKEIIACIYHASLYQEYCQQQAPGWSPPKVLELVLGDEGKAYTDQELIGDANKWIIRGNFVKMLMVSGFLVCRSTTRSIKLRLKNMNSKALTLFLKLIFIKDITLYTDGK